MTNPITAVWLRIFEAIFKAMFGASQRRKRGTPIEMVYRLSKTQTLPTKDWPDDSWGFHEPESPWTSEAPQPTTECHVLSSKRELPDEIKIGAPVKARWQKPTVYALALKK